MLIIKDICKTYSPKKGEPVVALDKVSVTIEDKGMVFILGKSGSGKSTFLNVVGGLDKYDSGELIIMDKSSKDFSQADFDSYRNTYIGFIFQEYNLLDEFTVAQNIALAMQLQGKKATSETLNTIMSEVDLEGYGGRKTNELSGGQKQRVAIARALVKDPQIIMADEPTGALDSNTGKQVFDTLKKLSKDKLVIVISHDREFAEQYGDRVIEFADGKIISDISKYIAPSKVASTGVQITDDKIIQIKKGYELTPADLKLINDYLKNNSENGTIISLDQKANTEVKKLARLNEDGDREAYKKTTKEDVVTKDYQSGDFKTIKSRLPYLNSLKIGASGLKAKPIRLFFTIILSSVAFALFGLAFTMASYNKIDAYTNSLIDSNVTYANFTKSLTYERDGYSSEQDALMTDSDVAALRTKYPTADLQPYYTAATDTYSRPEIRSLFNTGRQDGTYYTSSFAGFTELTTGTIDKLGFNFATTSSRLPTADNEIAITGYTYSQFKRCGYKQNSFSSTEVKINTESDLIGKTIEVSTNNGQKTFTVVGIINTGIESDDRYKDYSNPSDTPSAAPGLEAMLMSQELEALLRKSYHSMMFVNNGYVSKMVNETKSDGINANGYSFLGSYSVKISDAPLYSPQDSYYSNKLIPYSALGADSVLKLDESALGSKQILLPYSDESFVAKYLSLTFFNSHASVVDIYSRYGGGLDDNYTYTEADISSAPAEIQAAELSIRKNWGYINTYLPTIANTSSDIRDVDRFTFAKADLLRNYYNLYYTYDNYLSAWLTADSSRIPEAFKAGNTIYDNLKAETPADTRTELYVRYIRGDAYSTNAFAGYPSGQEIEKLVNKVRIKALFNEIKSSLDFDTAKIYVNYTKFETAIMTNEVYSVAGFYFTDNSDYGNIVFSDADIAALDLPVIGNYAGVLGVLNIEDKAAVKNMVEFNYTAQEGGVLFNLNSAPGTMLSLVNDIVETLSNVFLYIAIGFAAFAVLLLMNFISTSISYKKRDIGILRAVGARGSDVFGIFLNEAMIIAIINFAIALAATIGTVIGLNGLFRNNYGIQITILNFSIVQALLMLAISLGTAFVSSFLPVFKAARKRPIDAIRDK